MPGSSQTSAFAAKKKDSALWYRGNTRAGSACTASQADSLDQSLPTFLMPTLSFMSLLAASRRRFRSGLGKLPRARVEQIQLVAAAPSTA